VAFFALVVQRLHTAIRVELAALEAQTALVRFVISDTGIGIDNQQAERLFQPFTQANAQSCAALGAPAWGFP